MGNAIKILLGFFAVVFIKVFINASKLLEAKRLRDKYKQSFVKDADPFDEYIPQAKKLLKDAGLSDISIPALQPLGYHHAASVNVIISDNLNSKRADIVGAAASMFDELVGVYRMRLKDSYSIRYWIETVLYLPQRAVEYLGVKENAFTKILQLLYWIVTPLLILARTDFYQYIAELIGRVQ